MYYGEVWGWILCVKQLSAAAHIYRDKVQSSALFSWTPNTVNFDGSKSKVAELKCVTLKRRVQTCVLWVLKWDFLTWQSGHEIKFLSNYKTVSALCPEIQVFWNVDIKNSSVHLLQSYVNVTPSHKLFGFPWGGKILPLSLQRTLSPRRRLNTHIRNWPSQHRTLIILCLITDLLLSNTSITRVSVQNNCSR